MKISEATQRQLQIAEMHYYGHASDIVIRHHLKCIMLTYDYSRWVRYLDGKQRLCSSNILQ